MCTIIFHWTVMFEIVHAQVDRTRIYDGFVFNKYFIRLVKVYQNNLLCKLVNGQMLNN